MTADDPLRALSPAEQNERLAQVRHILEERLARDGEGPVEAARPADPARCARPLCRRSGVCSPRRGEPCADDWQERMRRELLERLVALREKEERRTGKREG